MGNFIMGNFIMGNAIIIPSFFSKPYFPQREKDKIMM